MSGWAIAAGLLVAVLGAVLIGNTWGRYTGATVSPSDPSALSERLSPHYGITRPEGDGPFPTALLLSGCDGPRDNLTHLAEVLKARGWASIVVDSHAPRGFDTLQRWRLICAGQLLTGTERAGDIAVALTDARAMPFVDGERIALVGASHGGWAALEYLSLADHGEVPDTLTEWPRELADAPLRGIVGAVALYPYCGPLSRVSRRGWTSALPVLFMLVDGDTIVSEAACLDLADRMAAIGLPVETTLYRGVTHGFDQAEKAPFSTLGHDPRATEAAHAQIADFLAARVE
jgi:dienelactone hydrolase